MRKTKFKRSEISFWELSKIMGIIIYAKHLIDELESKKIKVGDDWDKFFMSRFKKELNDREKSIVKKISETVESGFKKNNGKRKSNKTSLSKRDHR